ncbi:MAG: polyprenol monophosphomannose synthase [Actinobacteria bacterium]|nr:polyprenol monophosphomannose synthase [Actinomycetota bacterium]
MKTLVILPTHQEAGNIENVLRRLRRALPDANVLVVDDASTDGTCDVARALGEDLGNIEILSRPTKNGLGNAYRTGFEWGLQHDFDILCEIDADLSHEPEVLPQLVSAAAMGADLVIGSRYVPGGAIRGWPKNRLFLSRWGNRYVAFLLGLAINDATSGFRAFRAETVRRFDLASTTSDGYTFQVETTYRLVRGGARIVEIPIVFHERTVGASKMSGRIVREALLLVTMWGLRDILRGRRASPTIISRET